MILGKGTWMRLLARFARDHRGSVAVIAAVMLPLLLGSAALVGEYGGALLAKAENQRVSDLAAYAGAQAYIDTYAARKAAGDSDATAASLATQAMQAAARGVAKLNGVDPADVQPSLAASPRNADHMAVQVNILTQNPLILSQIFGTGPTVGASSESFAEIGVAQAAAEPEPTPQAGGCIVALAPAGTGITLGGGTSVTANDCEVSSNNTVTVPCGTTIKTKLLTYNSTSAPSNPCGGIQKPDGSPGNISKAPTPDPLLGNSGVATASARLATLSSLSAPSAPAAPVFTVVPNGGLSIDFAYSDSSTKAQAVALGCTATKSGSTWTLSCPSGTVQSPKTYNIANLTVGGGLNLDFALDGNGTSIYNFSGAISVDCCKIYRFGPGTYNFGAAFTNNSTVSFAAGSYNAYNFLGNFQHSGPSTTFANGPIRIGGHASLLNTGTVSIPASDMVVGGQAKITGSVTATFGNGNYDFRQGYHAEGGVTVNFAKGTYRFGQGTSDCNWNAGRVSFCNKSGAKTYFTGSSTFQFSNGIYNGATATFGTGTDNSFELGGSSLSNALRIDGGAQTILGDATGTGKLFQMIGSMNGGGGGSCTVLGAAAQHDIVGNLIGEGAIWLGNGVYTVDGYFWMGATSGGSATCNGQTISVRGDAVTIVVGGKNVPSSGSCANQAFCVGAGYNNIVLSAPETGVTADLVIIGPQDAAVTGGATWKEGAGAGKFSGAFYFPHGAIQMTGGAGASGGVKCLQLIGTQITLSGGTSAVSECTSLRPVSAGSGSGSGSAAVTVPSRPILIQ